MTRQGQRGETFRKTPWLVRRETSTFLISKTGLRSFAGHHGWGKAALTVQPVLLSKLNTAICPCSGPIISSFQAFANEKLRETVCIHYHLSGYRQFLSNCKVFIKSLLHAYIRPALRPSLVAKRQQSCEGDASLRIIRSLLSHAGRMDGNSMTPSPAGTVGLPLVGCLVILSLSRGKGRP